MTKKKEGMTRREVLGTGAAVGASLLVGNALSGEATAEAAKPRVPRRKLGKTGKKIPILLFGGAVPLDASYDIKLREAYKYGVDYFDAARMYGGGTCEPAIGSYMKKAKNRKRLWLTSKSQVHDPAGFKRELDKTLKDLSTNHVDLYFMHALKKKRYISKSMGKMAYSLKKAGKMKYMGFSCHNGNVAELMMEAAKHSWIDVIMFKYNFRSYGDKALNKAIDACAKANIGLIAMKTQGAANSFKSRVVKFQKTGKWTKPQAVLKAVWSDKRITAAVSHMDTLKKLRENVAAATNRTKLSALEVNELQRYASATRGYSCDGCDHLCGAQVSAPVQIGDTMRFLMYHDQYGEQAKARSLFAQLPSQARQIGGVDFRAAAAACPHGVDIPGLMERASKILV